MAIPLILRGLAASSDGKKSVEMLADTKQLQELAVKIKSLGPQNAHVKSGLHQIAALWENRIKSNFRRSVDPYDSKWHEIKHRDGQPLLDTGMLRNSINSEVRGLSIVLGSSIDYADKHQRGIGVRQRMFLPTPVVGLPDKWKNEYTKIMLDKVQKAVQ